MLNVKVGQQIWLVPWGNIARSYYHRNAEEEPFSATVTKVGRQYFYAVRDDAPLRRFEGYGDKALKRYTIKIDLETGYCALEGDCNSGYDVYFSAGEYARKRERTRKIKFIQDVTARESKMSLLEDDAVDEIYGVLSKQFEA